MEKTAAGTTMRTCRACGRKFEYPDKGSQATRHHCADCVALPSNTRKAVERIVGRIAQLELAVKRLQQGQIASKAASPPTPPPTATS